MKNIKAFIILIALLAPNLKGVAQKAALEDQNLTNYFKVNHPGFLDSSDSLLIDEAQNFSGTLELQGLEITNLSGLENFISISELNLSSNNITSLPNLCSLTELKVLNISNSAFTLPPSLTCLSNLEILILDNNELSASPDLSGLIQLTSVSLINCGLKDVPDGLKNLPNLIDVNVTYNRFTLNDILEFSEISDYTQIFTIVPQRPFVLTSSYTVDKGSTVILHTDNDAAISGVSYSLIKDNLEIVSKLDSGGFHLTNVSESDKGVYKIRYQTTQLPNVYLESVEITIELTSDIVNTCNQQLGLSFELTPYSCLADGELLLKSKDFTPSNFTVTSDNGYNLSQNNELFQDLTPGTYQAFASDMYCKSDTIEFQIQRVECSDLLKPNEGLTTVLLSYNDDLNIYNKLGNLLGSIRGPIDWDGTLQGELLPTGYYYIASEDKTKFYNITIIR